MMDSIQGEIDCLENEAGFVRLADHGVIQLTGEDRQKFLHSFCTADIKQLKPGDQTEAFILNGKGKSLCFANVLATEDRLLLVFNLASTAPDVIAHLDMYLIREDVELSDRSGELSVWFVSGSQAGDRLSEVGSSNLTVAPAEIAGDGWLLVALGADAEAIEASLAAKQIQLAVQRRCWCDESSQSRRGMALKSRSIICLRNLIATTNQSRSIRAVIWVKKRLPGWTRSVESTGFCGGLFARKL